MATIFVSPFTISTVADTPSDFEFRLKGKSAVIVNGDS